MSGSCPHVGIAARAVSVSREHVFFAVPDCMLDDKLPSLFLDTELLTDRQPPGLPGAGSRGPILLANDMLN